MILGLPASIAMSGSVCVSGSISGDDGGRVSRLICPTLVMVLKALPAAVPARGAAVEGAAVAGVAAGAVREFILVAIRASNAWSAFSAACRATFTAGCGCPDAATAAIGTPTAAAVAVTVTAPQTRNGRLTRTGNPPLAARACLRTLAYPHGILMQALGSLPGTLRHFRQESPAAPEDWQK
jgi:hypothetical protein